MDVQKTLKQCPKTFNFDREMHVFAYLYNNTEIEKPY